MLCNKCKKNIACYHCTIIVNGATRSEHLCSECSNLVERPSMVSSLKNILFGNMFNYLSNVNLAPCKSWSTNHNGIIDDAIKSINIGANKCRQDFGKKSQELNLKIQMQEAIEKEDYETAGKIKKQLDELRG